MKRPHIQLARFVLLATCLAGASSVGFAAQTHEPPVLTVDGERFRDLNRNNRLDPYEDWRLPAEQRADDLIKQMTLEEKAGTMMHGTLPGSGGMAIGVSSQGYDLEAARTLIVDKKITSFITRLNLPANEFAEQNNAVQSIAAGTRLGIPVTISTDPRNHFEYVLGASAEVGAFSQWPDPLGFGALRDPAMTRRFADIARQEYRAVGIHQALSPQADLATEPRWSRQTGTFGSSADLVSPLVQAYVAGFQNGEKGVSSDGVLTVVKHWVGYGAQPGGFDGHNYYGRFAVLDEPAFAEHVAAFQGAFAAGVEGVMPAYTILKDLHIDGRLTEQVAPGFSREILTDLLRGREGFQGIILSDWAITNDCTPGCRDPKKPQGFQDIAMPWGVEDLAEAERFAKGVDAGLDQFGGVDRPEIIIEAIQSGRLSETRIDESVRRIMLSKFRLGLFDKSLVDPAEARQTVGKAEFQAAAADVQRRAHVLLKDEGGLPLKPGTHVFVHGLDRDAVAAHGLISVDRPEDAEAAIFRLTTPSELLHPNHFFGSRQKEGRLDFRDGDANYEAFKAAASVVPVFASVYLDRPAILTNIADKATVLLANFGASDDALLDILMGEAQAEGRLPFELPTSMQSVEVQHPGRVDDSATPLFTAGYGIIRATD
ncbi:MAG TPA: glycoside hydrolase family 3 N-terminal domain-containing protein [Sphingomonadaceae bacterium]|nr:glycoside hydrolase family 3 N-terminal domain-containing protein [Sphingomonadaceae bacterium]